MKAGDYRMGCLVELCFDVMIEGVMELTAWCYMKLIQLIFPGKTVSDRARDHIKFVTGTLGLCSSLALIIGIILILQDGSITKTVGKYTILISLGLLLLPIVLGILVWIIRHLKSMKTTG